MNKTDNVVRNVLWGILSKSVNILLPFITRTILIRRLGIEYAGASSLFTSLLNILNITELGIGSALVYSMYKPIAEQNTEDICRLLNFYRKCYRMIGIITLVVGLAMLPFIDYLVKGDVPDGTNLRILFLIYLFNSVIGYFLFAYKQSLFLATQQVRVTSRINIISTIFLNFVQMASLLLIGDYYVYVFIIPIATALNNICIGLLSKKTFPEYVCEGKIYDSEKQQMKKRVTGLLFQKIGSVILKSVDTIVISAFLGLNILGVYNGYFYIITAVESFIAVVNQTLIPTVGNCVISSNKEDNYRLLERLHFGYFWALTVCSTCMMCLFQPFMKMWQGENNVFDLNVVCLIVVVFFLHRIIDITYVFSDAIGLWWKARYVTISAAAINLVFNIVLVNCIGIYGIMLSTIVSLVFVYHTLYTRVLFLEYFKSREKWVKFLLTLIVYFIAAFLIVGLNYLICALIPFNGFVLLVTRLIVCVTLSNFILWVIYRKDRRYTYFRMKISGYVSSFGVGE